jgi:hypothetical protein
MLLRSTLGLAMLLSVPSALTVGPATAGADSASRPAAGVSAIDGGGTQGARVMVGRPFATPAPAAAPGQAGSNPAVDIKGPPANFEPGSVTAPEIASGSTCSATNYSFMLANVTHETRTVTLSGHEVVALPPKQSTVFCAADTGSGSFSLTFHLSHHPKARLVATFSASPSAP